MSKIYLVEVEAHDEWIEMMANAPHTEFTIVKIFASKELASSFIEENFVHYMNEWKGFCNLQISERDLEEELNVVDEASTSDGCMISATLDSNRKLIHITDTRKVKEEDVSEEEMGYWDHMDKIFRVSYRVPKNLHKRSEIVEYLEKKAAGIKINK